MFRSSHFQTRDPFLASYLLAQNNPLTYQNDRGQIVFVFSSSPELDRLVADFNGNGSVPVQDFVQSFKQVRTNMYTLRGNPK